MPNEVADEVLTDVRRLRDLWTGAASLRSPELVRGALLEARALADSVVDKLEQNEAVQAELARSSSSGNPNQGRA